eukprot:TRINITY_DN6993_c1_g1_i1.p1 TRINITY_DN6993_c1_g1~~TRINITY_DN6993_c1_g1_i1.p1  ORF type:complete len:134 (-),score=19.39 TRINITY_DN6993_c1_g1_i1:533-934(-)
MNFISILLVLYLIFIANASIKRRDGDFTGCFFGRINVRNLESAKRATEKVGMRLNILDIDLDYERKGEISPSYSFSWCDPILQNKKKISKEEIKEAKNRMEGSGEFIKIFTDQYIEKRSWIENEKRAAKRKRI